MAMYSNLVESLQLMIETSLSEINTSLPGTVVSYDAPKNRAVVRPSLPRRLASEESLPAPQIVEVPVTFHSSGGGNASFTMPLKPGDPVTLHFQQRSLEIWLSGSTTMPDDPRQFDLSDCIATPGGGHTGTVAHPENVVLKFGNANLTLFPDGKIVIGNSNANITMDAGGVMTIHGQSIKINTPANSFTLETHRHSQGPDGRGDAEANTNPPLAGS